VGVLSGKRDCVEPIRLGPQHLWAEPCTDSVSWKRTDADILEMQVDAGQCQEIQARCSGKEKLPSPEGSKTGDGTGLGIMGRVWPCRERRLFRKRKCL